MSDCQACRDERELADSFRSRGFLQRKRPARVILRHPDGRTLRLWRYCRSCGQEWASTERMAKAVRRLG